MGKNHTNKSPRQDLAAVNAATVQIPLPLLSALEDAESAFFGLCVETGKQVLATMMEQDRVALCGPAGRHDTEREAVRAGSSASAIVLGGRRIGMRRPRVRSLERGEVRLPSFEAASREDPLDRHTLEAIASGVTMRRYARSLEPLPAAEPANAPSHLWPADAGDGGITWATGSPRRVMTMDRPVRRTRSRTARQVALNSEMAIFSVFSAMR